MSLQDEIRKELIAKGADFIRFVDISGLLASKETSYSNAILFGVSLSSEYLKRVMSSPDYVSNIKRNNLVHEDEFHLKEQQTDKMADELTDFITHNGFRAFSQSEHNLVKEGWYIEKSKKTLLPHKTIALMSGMGWIGKNNLLVTKDYGCAISMCSVLTDAPLDSSKQFPMKTKCGDCTTCKNICSGQALEGYPWSICTSRDRLIDVYKCDTCLKCMVHCPYTQGYIKGDLI